MSYPWWLWRITWIKDNGEKSVEDWTMTGLDPNDALSDFLIDVSRGTGDAAPKQAEGWRPVGFEYVRCDTFGIDPESDKAIMAEAQAEGGPDVYWCGGCGKPDCGFCRATQEPPRRDRLQVGDYGE